MLNQFSFWIQIALATKICFSRIVINRAKIPLYYDAPSFNDGIVEKSYLATTVDPVVFMPMLAATRNLGWGSWGWSFRITPFTDPCSILADLQEINRVTVHTFSGVMLAQWGTCIFLLLTFKCTWHGYFALFPLLQAVFWLEMCYPSDANYSSLMWKQDCYSFRQSVWLSSLEADFEDELHRGYYTVARRYEFYFQVVKTIFYERAQRVSKILFLTRENKIHIFKPPCNFLFIT